MAKENQPQGRQHNNISFLHKVNSGKSNQVFLMRGNNNGHPAWYYLMVDKLKLMLLQRDIKLSGSKAINLEKYGQIIHHGWGHEPLENLVQKIEEEYG